MIIYCNWNLFLIYIVIFLKREERFQFVQYSLYSIFGFGFGCIGASFSAAHSNKTSFFNLFNLLLWIIYRWGNWCKLQILQQQTHIFKLANYLTNGFAFWNTFQCFNETKVNANPFPYFYWNMKRQLNLSQLNRTTHRISFIINFMHQPVVSRLIKPKW